MLSLGDLSTELKNKVAKSSRNSSLVSRNKSEKIQNLRTDPRKWNGGYGALRTTGRTTGGIAIDAPVIDTVERSEDWFNNAGSAENEQ